MRTNLDKFLLGQSASTHETANMFKCADNMGLIQPYDGLNYNHRQWAYTPKGIAHVKQLFEKSTTNAKNYYSEFGFVGTPYEFVLRVDEILESNMFKRNAGVAGSLFVKTWKRDNFACITDVVSDAIYATLDPFLAWCMLTYFRTSIDDIHSYKEYDYNGLPETMVFKPGSVEFHVDNGYTYSRIHAGKVINAARSIKDVPMGTSIGYDNE